MFGFFKKNSKEDKVVHDLSGGDKASETDDIQVDVGELGSKGYDQFSNTHQNDNDEGYLVNTEHDENHGAEHMNNEGPTAKDNLDDLLSDSEWEEAFADDESLGEESKDDFDDFDELDGLDDIELDLDSVGEEGTNDNPGVSDSENTPTEEALEESFEQTQEELIVGETQDEDFDDLDDLIEDIELDLDSTADGTLDETVVKETVSVEDSDSEDMLNETSSESEEEDHDAVAALDLDKGKEGLNGDQLETSDEVNLEEALQNDVSTKAYTPVLCFFGTQEVIQKSVESCVKGSPVYLIDMTENGSGHTHIHHGANKKYIEVANSEKEYSVLDVVSMITQAAEDGEGSFIVFAGADTVVDKVFDTFKDTLIGMDILVDRIKEHIDRAHTSGVSIILTGSEMNDNFATLFERVAKK